jgi:hypothetical protein
MATLVGMHRCQISGNTLNYPAISGIRQNFENCLLFFVTYSRHYQCLELYCFTIQSLPCFEIDRVKYLCVSQKSGSEIRQTTSGNIRYPTNLTFGTSLLCIVLCDDEELSSLRYIYCSSVNHCLEPNRLCARATADYTFRDNRYIYIGFPR